MSGEFRRVFASSILRCAIVDVESRMDCMPRHISNMLVIHSIKD